MPRAGTSTQPATKQDVRSVANAPYVLLTRVGTPASQKSRIGKTVHRSRTRSRILQRLGLVTSGKSVLLANTPEMRSALIRIYRNVQIRAWQSSEPPPGVLVLEREEVSRRLQGLTPRSRVQVVSSRQPASQRDTMSKFAVSRESFERAVARYSPGLPQSEIETRVSKHQASRPRTGEGRLAALGRLEQQLAARREAPPAPPPAPLEPPEPTMSQSSSDETTGLG
jgi:hypothetical protein